VLAEHPLNHFLGYSAYRSTKVVSSVGLGGRNQRRIRLAQFANGLAQFAVRDFAVLEEATEETVMRPFVLMLFSLLFAGCATHPLPLTTAFNSLPRYPVTEIEISPSLKLRHIAGRPCDDNSTARPLVGSESTRTYSFYELLDPSGSRLLAAPSMLSDPAKEIAEFKDWYRKYDQLTVCASATRNTIVIIENRSPAGPDEAHIVLQWTPRSGWRWSQMSVPTFTMDPHLEYGGGPLNQAFPEIVGLNDTEVRFRAVGKVPKVWSQRFEKIGPWSSGTPTD
jgi:hypothetical protein